MARGGVVTLHGCWVPQLSFQTVQVGFEDLQKLTRDILLAQGVPAEDAVYVAWHLVETNLRGTDSHGVARLSHYVRRLRAGGIRAKPRLRFERRAPSLGIVDGDHGLGHIVMRAATEKAALVAMENGSGWIWVCNSSHCGALAPFGLQLAEQGMVSFVFTHVDPMVLPYGAIQPFCGTNPVCLTAPGADGKTLCLDMATSIVPWNVVANAQNEGVAIPTGVAVDSLGNDTTDPNAVHALYPFGQYKGSGLGIMIDVLCAMFSGAPYGPDIPRMYGNDMSEHRRLGGLVGAICVNHMADLAFFRQRVAEMALRLGSLATMAGYNKVRYPGELEQEEKIKRMVHGIPIGLHVLADLNSLASEVSVAELQPLTG